MSFTQQHFSLQAKALGSHVIPEMCTRPNWNAGGALHWDVNQITAFHRLGDFIVDYFKQQNPAFNLDRFNKKMLEHAEAALYPKSPWLVRDLQGLRIAGKERKPTDWTFYPICTNKGEFIG